MAIHQHNDWEIESVGGHITMKRFIARKDLPDGEYLFHWTFKLKDCKVLCDERDAGKEIHPLYLKSLYR